MKLLILQGLGVGSNQGTGAHKPIPDKTNILLSILAFGLTDVWGWTQEFRIFYKIWHLP